MAGWEGEKSSAAGLKSSASGWEGKKSSAAGREGEKS